MNRYDDDHKKEKKDSGYSVVLVMWMIKPGAWKRRECYIINDGDNDDNDANSRGMEEKG